MAEQLALFAGNAHPELSMAIAKEIGIGLVDATVGAFTDGETSVKIKDNVREKDVFVLQPTGPPANQNAMEAFLMVDALQRASAARITIVTPYFGYARQDRKDTSRVPISAKAMVNLFEAAGVDRFLAVDLHAGQIQGFTDKPFDHLYAASTITEGLDKRVEAPVFVSPDISAGKMARKFAKLNGTPDDWAIVDKERTDGTTTHVKSIIGIERVKDRNVVLVDDMASTGGSLIKAAKVLKEEGGALEVSAAVTHGVLCGDAVSDIDGSDYLSQLYTTDTLPKVGSSAKITRISIAPLLGKAITAIHDGRSVSDLF
jgi:ribose-phosphate pyrophosphokinase